MPHPKLETHAFSDNQEKPLKSFEMQTPLGVQEGDLLIVMLKPFEEDSDPVDFLPAPGWILHDNKDGVAKFIKIAGKIALWDRFREWLGFSTKRNPAVFTFTKATGVFGWFIRLSGVHKEQPMNQLDEFKDLLADDIFEDEEERKRFDEASNHPYECKCELCQEWWVRMDLDPEEEEEQ